jgi:Glycosyl transferase family 11
MLTVGINAGLGNQMFKLASLEGIAKETNRCFYLNQNSVYGSPHSQRNYFESIFKNWKQYISNQRAVSVKDESSFRPMIWHKEIPDDKNINYCLDGYLQRWEYIHPIRDTFIERLTFNKDIVKKYPDIGDMVFVHIRGGDYIGSDLHHVDLTDYYKKCLDAVHPQTLILFTNDKPYAMKIMEGRSFVNADENEEDSLYLMSKCKGGIMGNSTFAWWGAYMNPNRQIFMPSKWFLDSRFDSSGYFFPGATVVQV